MTFVNVRQIEDPEAQDRAFPPPASGLGLEGACVACNIYIPQEGSCCAVCVRRRPRLYEAGLTQGEFVKRIFEDEIAHRREMRRSFPDTRWNSAWNGKVWGDDGKEPWDCPSCDQPLPCSVHTLPVP